MTMLQGVRSNCDLTMIWYKKPMFPDPSEYQKGVGYIVDYASKSTDTVTMTHKKMRMLIANETDTQTGIHNLRRVATKCINQMAKDKLMSKQEAVCLMAKLDLYKCSESIDNVSITDSQSIDSDGKITSRNEMSKYAARDSYYDLSFYNWQIAKQRQWQNSSNKGFIPHIVGPDCYAVYPFTDAYAKNALKVHKPWHGNFEASLDSTRTIMSQFVRFVNSKECPKILKNSYIRAKSKDENKLPHHQPCAGSAIPEVDPNDQYIDESTREACNGYATMAVANDVGDLNCNLDFGLNNNWTAQRVSIPANMDITKVSNFVMDQANAIMNDNTYNTTPKLDIPLQPNSQAYSSEDLENDQQQVYHHVMATVRQWIAHNKQNDNREKRNDAKHECAQLLLTVSGAGGSGKSMLVKTLIGDIRQMFQENNAAIVAAPTGSASFNGGGKTMHSLFKLPVNPKDDDIQAVKAKELKQTFQNVILLVYDERSMVSAENLAMMNAYSQQVAHSGANSHRVFGGIPVVMLVGDDYQLPPVIDVGASGCCACDLKPSLNPFKRKMVQAGLDLFRMFGLNTIKLQTSKRILNSQDFLVSCLKGVRGDTKCGLSSQQIQKMMRYHINSPEWTMDKVEQVTNNAQTIHLFATNSNKNDHNQKQLELTHSREKPVAVIRSTTTGMCKTKMRDHYDENRVPVMCMICVGCKVSLSGINIKPEWGLYHGSIGKVLDIVFATEKGPHETDENESRHPLYVMVDFPQYCGPNLYADDNTMPEDDKENRKTWVPVPMVDGRCANHGQCSRCYMPLTLAFGKTIHSFQGASVGPTQPGRPENTYKRIICDPGTRKFEGDSPGLFYTLLSRATTFGDGIDPATSAILFMGQNMNESRVKNITMTAKGLPYKTVTNLKSWVKHLEDHQMTKATDAQVEDTMNWVAKMKQQPIDSCDLARWVHNYAV